MKILSLDLIAFGPFTDLRLDLSGGEQGLHVVHGPNEAGKSSTLRALSDFLFGIPERSTDDFVHKKTNMRIGATLRDGAGIERSLVRRKGRGATLRRADGQPFDDAAFARALGGLTREVFERHHRIDHAQLVAGGKDMSEGEGDFGRMLFSAGSGVAGFRTVLDAVEGEMKELFAPRAQNASINSRLNAYKEKRQERTRLSLPTRTWVEANERKIELDRTLAGVDADLRRLSAERRGLDRLAQRLPVAALLREARARLSALGTVRPLPDDFAERRIKVEQFLPEEIRRRDEAEAALQAIAEELDRLPPPDAIVDDADELERVREEKGGALKSLDAGPKYRRGLELLEAEIQGLAAEFGSPARLDLDALKIPPKERKAVEKLRDEFKLLAKSHADALANLAALDDGAGRDESAPTVGLDELKIRLSRWQGRAHLDETVALGRAKHAAALAKAEAALKRLSLWTGSRLELDEAVPPGEETVARFQEEKADRDRAIRDQGLKIQELVDEIATLEEASARDRLDGGVPSEADLAALRDDRDALWLEIRKAAGPADATLAERFEKLLRATDQAADRLRREADRVARESQRRLDQAALERKRLKIAVKLDDLRKAEEEAARAWIALWAPIGVRPASPKEMLAWLKKRDEVVQLGRAAEDLRLEVESSERLRADLLAEIAATLRDADAVDSLAANLDRAQAALLRLERRERLEQSRVQASKAERDLDDWRSRWATAVASLGVDLDPDGVSDHFAKRDELLRKHKEAASKRHEAAEHQAVVEAFESRVRTLAARHAPDLVDLPASRVAVDLLNRLSAAKGDADKRRSALERREASLEARAKAEAGIADALAKRELLLAVAGTEDLAKAEADWNAFKDQRRQVADFEERLIALGEGRGLDDLMAEAATATTAEVESRIAEIDRQLQPLEAGRDELNREIGRLAKELEQWDGGSGAAEAEQDAQAVLARVANDAETYVRLRLGAALLKKAIDRYREKNSGPILRRASVLFAALTLGGFAQLRVEPQDKNTHILYCLRRSGEEVAVENLSEGTADALYLALRLAALHAELDAREPIPFVVDDILVNLDERRSAAALDVLADLSKRTQVLLFTHHAHVVDLARSRLDEGTTLFVHKLPDPMRDFSEAALPALSGLT